MKATETTVIPDGEKIDQITGTKGTLDKHENVYKVSFPRADVKVAVDGVAIPPFMGLASYAAFKPVGKEGAVTVMGDTALFQDEVNPVMSAALDSGLTVTALHNHFFYDEPKMYFMHIGGEGSVDALAAGVRKIQDKVKEIRSAAPTPASRFSHEPLPAKSAVTAAPLARTLGSKAAEKDGMVKFNFNRTPKMPSGSDVGMGGMGFGTWAAFYGSDAFAFMDGDLVTFEGELQPVLKALRANDINIVAIHNHMEGETPRAIFVHVWGVGPAGKLAQGLKAALDTQKPAKT
jgi:hypothetical protein